MEPTFLHLVKRFFFFFFFFFFLGFLCFYDDERIRKPDIESFFFALIDSFSLVGFATFHDQSHIIELLLQAGADKEDKFEVGGVKYTPIEFAEQKGKKKALKTLQTYKVKPPRAAAASATASAEPAVVAVASASSAAPAAARSAPIAAERTLLVFPGQGAQKVGMGTGLDSIPRVKVCLKIEALYVVNGMVFCCQEMISKAKEILGYDVWDICLNGPEAKLNSTLVSQPALYLVSLAALEKVRVSLSFELRFSQSKRICS